MYIPLRYIELLFALYILFIERELLFDEVLSNTLTEKSLERRPPKTKHYKHFLENLI